MRYEKTEKWYEQLRNDISIRATEKMKWATEKDMSNWEKRSEKLRYHISNREGIWSTEKRYRKLRKNNSEKWDLMSATEKWYEQKRKRYEQTKK